MSYEIISKYLTYDQDNRVESTIVQIVEHKPYYVAITQELNGDQLNESEQNLIDKVIKQFYQTKFKDLANEERIDELNKQQETMQLAMMEMMEMVMQSMTPPMPPVVESEEDENKDAEGKVTKDDKQTETDVDDSDSEKGGD